MTLFDYVVLTILVTSIIISMVRGLMREILSLAAWVAAFLVASTWGNDAAGIIPPPVPAGAARLLLGFGILFIGTLILVSMINMALHQMIKAAGLQLADHGLGGLFGLARGLVIVLTLAIGAGLTSLPQQPLWRNALSAPVVEAAAHALKPLLPEEWARHVHF